MPINKYILEIIIINSRRKRELILIQTYKGRDQVMEPFGWDDSPNKTLAHLTIIMAISSALLKQ